MKRVIIWLMVLLFSFVICGCVDDSNDKKETSNDGSKYEIDYSDTEYDDTDDYSNDDYDYDDDYSSGGSYSSFSNDYGSSTTTCAKSGCYNKIASSGDTAYCTSHSNKCLECYCYIDGDALYCLDCLSDAADAINDDYNYSYDYDNDYDNDNDNDYSHECYVCGSSAYSKYGSYYYCSSCLALVKAFS